MKKRLIPLLLILLSMSTMSLQAQKSVTLRLNPQKNHNYTIKSKTSTMNLMEIQGQSMTSTQILEGRQTFSAKDISAQEITLEGKAEAIKVTVSQMGMTLTYDSEHPEKTSPMLAGQTESLNEELNKPITAKLDLQGNLIDEDDESSIAQFGSAVIPLPTDPVTVGSTWTSEKTQNINDIKINAKMTYTVKKISKRSIEIDIQGTVESDEDASGSYEGTASLNPETGLITSSTIKQNFSLTVSEQGMSFPTTITGTSTITVE